MMFKLISMHSKPCKHAKSIEILTIILTKHDFSNNLKDLNFCPKNICAPKVINRQNVFFSMSSIFCIIQSPLIKLKIRHFDNFTFVLLVIYIIFWKKWKLPYQQNGMAQPRMRQHRQHHHVRASSVGIQQAAGRATTTALGWPRQILQRV